MDDMRRSWTVIYIYLLISLLDWKKGRDCTILDYCTMVGGVVVLLIDDRPTYDYLPNIVENYSDLLLIDQSEST